MMRRMNLGFLLCRPFCFLAAYTIFRDEHTHTLYKIENRNSIARPAAVERLVSQYCKSQPGTGHTRETLVVRF